MKKKIFSAIQPTGKLTIGHYAGILNNWFYFQNKFNCFYCIADLHSLTNTFLNFKKNELKNNIFDIVAFLLALNIDYKKCTIFLQSSVKEHVQLNWILNCYTYIGELKRMTQFKSKIKNNNKNILNCGLFNYPILMSSDILLYKSDYVSIGLDQVQHLELTRKIAKRFNKLYSSNIFTIPKYILSNNGSKIMSLLNPKKKMSKSDFNKNNVLFLLDDFNSIRKKINSAVTDIDFPPKINFDLVNKPGISNLLNIMSIIKNISINSLEKMFFNFSYKNFKKELINELDVFLYPIQKKYFYFRKNEFFLKNILLKGKIRAKNSVKKLISNIKNLFGIDFF